MCLLSVRPSYQTGPDQTGPPFVCPSAHLGRTGIDQAVCACLCSKFLVYFCSHLVKLLSTRPSAQWPSGHCTASAEGCATAPSCILCPLGQRGRRGQEPDLRDWPAWPFRSLPHAQNGFANHCLTMVSEAFRACWMQLEEELVCNIDEKEAEG